MASKVSRFCSCWQTWEGHRSQEHRGPGPGQDGTGGVAEAAPLCKWKLVIRLQSPCAVTVASCAKPLWEPGHRALVINPFQHEMAFFSFPVAFTSLGLLRSLKKTNSPLV